MGRVKVKQIPRNVRDPILLAWVGVAHDMRVKRGWTMTDLANFSGLTRQAISHYENDDRVPRADTMTRVSRAFGLEYSKMIRMAERRCAKWPALCQKRNYCCVECGRLKCWNPARGCSRSGR